MRSTYATDADFTTEVERRNAEQPIPFQDALYDAAFRVLRQYNLHCNAMGLEMEPSPSTDCVLKIEGLHTLNAVPTA